MNKLLVSILVLLIPLSYSDQNDRKIKDLKEKWQTKEGTRVIIEDFSVPLCDSSCVSTRMEWLQSESNPFALPKQQESSDIKEVKIGDVKAQRISRPRCGLRIRKIF